MYRFRSYWYYWYTGHKTIAVISMILTAMVLTLGLLVNAQFALWAIITAVLLDILGIWLLILYVLIIRAQIPALMLALMLAQADQWVIHQLMIPVLIAFFVGRFVTYIVAKQSISATSTKRPLP
ncbi:MAG: hypothetical protein WAQ53_04480 [Thiofilum sp.]|uniref:hypothetical protein n=1 Tax=Thiofilum sp. TaxID=2212733 RepID=UPI0025E4BCC8|nr:hypothetical protein [Thiofilum sp.]MBK8453906.1 hypothetical protein [Thiofilum sp.]